MNWYKTEVIAAMVDGGASLDAIKNVLTHVRFPRKPRILGTSLKVQKSTKDNTLTAVVYLAASKRSAAFGGMNTCPWASAGCAAACLGHTSGRLTMNSSQNAQMWKTLLFRWSRALFVGMLTDEIDAHARKAERKGLHCSVRLNGSSDIPWERVAPELFTAFPNVQFYDYTKSPLRANQYASHSGRWPSNYHLTFSRSEDTPDSTIDLLVENGCNVAVVFRTEPYGGEWRGIRVIDGDTSDYRAADPRGVIVGLSVKGNVDDDTGFYV